MLYFFVLVTIAYGVLIITLIIGYSRIREELLINYKPNTTFSIVIPFRNEAINLPALLASVKTLDYPVHLFELILVDDESTDNSTQLITAFQECHAALNIRLSTRSKQLKSPKKDAVNTGISLAKNSWIIGTDADCTVPKNWLRTYDQFIQQNNCGFIAGPVAFKKSKGFLHHFQVLNFLSLAGVTVGSFGLGNPAFCNGANMAYNKQDYFELNGFLGNDEIVSGDDVFLLEKFKNAYPERTHYLRSKEAMVQTETMDSCRDFLQQQFRWAAKSTGYSSSFTKLMGILTVLMNASVLLLLILALSNTQYEYVLLWIVALKLLVDFMLLNKAARFLDHKASMLLYPISGLLYPFFSIFTAIGAFSRPFRWKERQFTQ